MIQVGLIDEEREQSTIGNAFIKVRKRARKSRSDSRDMRQESRKGSVRRNEAQKSRKF
jgi:hypothetical protein